MYIDGTYVVIPPLYQIFCSLSNIFIRLTYVIITVCLANKAYISESTVVYWYDRVKKSTVNVYGCPLHCNLTALMFVVRSYSQLISCRGVGCYCHMVAYIVPMWVFLMLYIHIWKLQITSIIKLKALYLVCVRVSCDFVKYITWMDHPFVRDKSAA